MTTLEKAGAVASIALPLLAGSWYAGVVYVEVSDRMAVLEDKVDGLEGMRTRYEREQTMDKLVNERVEKLAGEVDWLRYHHHHNSGEGRPHVD